MGNGSGKQRIGYAMEWIVRLSNERDVFWGYLSYYLPPPFVSMIYLSSLASPGKFSGKTPCVIIAVPRGFDEQTVCSGPEHGHGIIYKRLSSIEDSRRARVMRPGLRQV